MKAKYFLVALIVTSAYGVAFSHIVTSAHVDLPLLTCMRSLTNSIRISLCPDNGPYRPEFYNSDIPMLPREVDEWEPKHRIIRDCCMRPCSVAEMMTIC